MASHRSEVHALTLKNIILMTSVFSTALFRGLGWTLVPAVWHTSTVATCSKAAIIDRSAALKGQEPDSPSRNDCSPNSRSNSGQQFTVLSMPKAPDIAPGRQCNDPVTCEFFDRCNLPRPERSHWIPAQIARECRRGA